MKAQKYAMDLRTGDKLYHWDGEGQAETITEIRQSYKRTSEGKLIVNHGYLLIKCQTYNMLVHRNDLRTVEI